METCLMSTKDYHLHIFYPFFFFFRGLAIFEDFWTVPRRTFFFFFLFGNAFIFLVYGGGESLCSKNVSDKDLCLIDWEVNVLWFFPLRKLFEHFETLNISLDTSFFGFFLFSFFFLFDKVLTNIVRNYKYLGKQDSI